MKIMYLNVNGFLGDLPIKSTSTYFPKRCRDTQLPLIVSNLILEKIKKENENEPYDAIFLSEFDPHSKASNNFIEQMNKDGYKEIFSCGQSQKDIDKKYSTSTICFMSNNCSNFNKCSDAKTEFLQFCKIDATSPSTPSLFAVHFSPDRKEMLNALETTLNHIENRKHILFFGDVNANPDSSEKQAQLNNHTFTELIQNNHLDLKEIYDCQPPSQTTRYETRIDRVFSNVKGIQIKTDKTYFEEGLSDHAALKITFQIDDSPKEM